MARSEARADATPVSAQRDIFDLNGKVAFIPGGYGGIGQAVTYELASRGAHVVVAGRHPERAQSLVRQLTSRGCKALALGLDVQHATQVRDAVALVVETYGGIDILVNCVGAQIEEPLLQVSEAAFDSVYGVNLKGAMFMGQAVAQQQVRAGTAGRHVHILSVRSQLGLRGRGYSSYVASKGGLAALIRQHAVELAPYGITVNGVAPTFVRTELVRAYLEDAAFRAGLEARIPLGRIAEPADVVGPVTFFVSPAGSFVTGQVLFVDGGVTASQ